MKKARMLAKISLKYWLHHKRRFFTLMLALVLGVSALCCTALLVRSEKDAVLESELYLLGNFDIQILGASKDTVEKLRKDENVIAIGAQYELGYVKTDTGAQGYCAALEDKEAEDICHMTCLRGRYPEKEDEVTMDVGTAKSLGVMPYPDEKVTLSLYSPDDKKLAEKEYTLVGVFEGENTGYQGEQPDGKWLRCPFHLLGTDHHTPSVYFHISQNEIFKSNNITMFVQTDVDDPYVVCQSANALTKDFLQFSIDNGRRYAYSYTLGINGVSSLIWEKYGGSTPSNIEAAMKNGDTIKDFYSQFIMPLLTVMIFIIIILSVVGLTRNIIKDKQENFAVLRSLGLEKRHLIGYIFCDFTVTALICIGIGLGLGSAAHIGLINFLNGAFDLKLNYGFDCVKYVNEVTYNPYLLSVVTILICVEVSVLIAIFSFRGKTPVQMFAEGKPRRRRFHRAKAAGRYRSWKWLLVRRIKLRNLRIAVISIIVMSVALTGYTYFQAFADRQNNELYWEKKNSGLDYWDYSAKTGDGNRYLFGIENHHENGVTVSDYQKLKEQDFVDDSFALAAVSSTRLSFAQGALDDKAQRDFKKFELKKYADTDVENAHEFDIAQKESEEAMIEKIGYKKTDLIYACPSVALFDDALDELDKFVVDGKIDKQKLKDGSEVLLVMDITNKIKFEKLFKAGDKLPLSDVVLNEKEEKIDFNNLNVDELGEPAYQKKVKNYAGEEAEERSYAIGKRKDIDVKIGAVLILDLDVAHKYMAEAAGGDCGLNVFCAPESFKAWGIGERNLSQVYMKLTGESEITRADVYWYSLMAGARGVETNSTAEISAKMDRGKKKIMCVYYSMIVIVTLTAAVMIAITLYTDIRMRSRKFAMLRACGMTTRQIMFMIWRQNIVYPIIGGVCAVFPVKWCQMFLEYVQDKIVSGEWIAENGSWKHEWAYDVPFNYNLFDYNVKRTLMIIFAVYVVIMLLVTLPQMRFIRKQSIVQEIERSSF